MPQQVIQMQVIQDCAPIPAVIDGEDQSKFGPDFIIMTQQKNDHHRKKMPRPVLVDVSEIKNIQFLDAEGKKKEMKAVRVHMRGKTPWFPAFPFISPSPAIQFPK